MKYRSLLVIALGMLMAVSCSSPDQAEQADNKEVVSDSIKALKEKAAKQSEEQAKNFESSAFWTGTLAGVYDHTGSIDLTVVDFTVENGFVSSGTFTADLNSITATDENYSQEDGKTKEDLIQHLKSDDFLSVKEHPEATFVITSANASKKIVTGDLTIKGITKEQVISNVKVSGDGNYAKGFFEFDRNDFDISFKHPMKDMVISDRVQISVMLQK